MFLLSILLPIIIFKVVFIMGIEGIIKALWIAAPELWNIVINLSRWYEIN